MLATLTITDIGFLLLAGFGFAVATHIFEKKKQKTKLICPMRAGDCDTVVHSTHSTFLGMAVEKWGMGYYTSIFITHTFMIFAPTFYPDVFLGISIVLSSGAVLFSLYLLALQAFVLRKWCTWCVTSAVTSMIIFVLSISTYASQISLLVARFEEAIMRVHLMAIILGAVIAIASSVILVQFLRDQYLSDHEHDTLRVLSEIGWFALGGVILTVLPTVIWNCGSLATLPRLTNELAVLVILAVGHFLLAHTVFDSLVHGSFTDSDPVALEHFKKLRRIARTLTLILVWGWVVVLMLAV